MRKIFAFLMIFIVSLSVACIAQEKHGRKPSEIEKVKVGISATSLLPALIVVGKEKGFFLGEGIDLEIVGYPTGKDALEATLNGEVDVGTVADMPIVSQSFERNDFYVFATITDSAQHVKALARKDRKIRTPQDIKGKKVATTLGTTSHFFLHTFFVTYELDPTDVEIVNLRPKEMVFAILDGEVDAIFAWEPNILNAKRELGGKGIQLPSAVGYMATFNLVTKKDFIEKNPELIRNILKALIKTEEFVKANPEESIGIIAKHLETNSEDIAGLWDTYKFRVSISQQLLITLEEESRWMQKENITDSTNRPNYLDYIYLDTLEELKPESVTLIH